MAEAACVIFDCDGVLVDSEAISKRVTLELAAEELGLSAEQIAVVEQRPLGMSDDDLFAEFGKRYGIEIPVSFMVHLSMRKTEAYEQGVETIPGAKGLVARVAMAGLARCVATSGTLPETEAKIKAAGLDGWFRQHYYCAQMVRRGKPAPDLFLYAADFEDCPIEGCVVIEDSANGVRAAVEAGMRCIGFAPKGDTQGLSDLGAEVVQTLADVPALLGIK